MIAAASPTSAKTYGTYWARMDQLWGERPVDTIRATNVEALQHDCTVHARPRERNSRGGRYAGENANSAARAFFRRAEADGLIPPGTSPTHRVPKPRRLPNTRRALLAWEIQEITEVARTTGNDAVLDNLLLRLHTETACRRGGALALCRKDLDTRTGLVRLREKGETLRWQPITLHLATSLADHARLRGASQPDAALLRYRNGQPLTTRRYDALWNRIGSQLPWVAAQGISTQWLRHTTLTWVESNFGYGIARAYAGHTDITGPATNTYIKADIHAVATALSALTGEPHPLALDLKELGFLT
ncbi:tyrosine-type recombinase/integrase [Actinoplanes sp. NPDC020271]|uniref:tyrosine-type recombinase/integrase n=1 Tax=Actinoplanes sp. NPDC020271 TaxID=3363896 RepID=UPI003792F3A5